MQSFADLKKKRGLAETSKLAEQMAAAKTGGKFDEDKRYWYPDVDKSGNGFCVIRFLPAHEGEDFPYVRLWSHNFKGPTGKWYIENSLTTIGQQDPLSEENTRLWNMNEDKECPFKKQARVQKRKLNYHANILVITDKQKPENEGKVFLFRFGPKIFEKLSDAMNPKFEDDAPLNPFDLWEGANFKIKITTVGEYRNYDKSEFAPRSALFDGDDKQLEAVWKQTHSLQALVAPDKFKSYEALKAQLDKVLGSNPSRTPSRRVEEDSPEEPEAAVAAAESKITDLKRPAKKATVKTDDAEDDDEDLDYYTKLANKA